MQRTSKATTSRGKRVLQKRAPQLVEEEKNAVILNGPKSSLLVNSVLSDLYSLKKPHAVRFTRKNEIRPFEDTGSLEFLTTKSEASLFAIGMHSKKRPHCVVLGRTFDHHVLDMFELQVVAYTPMSEFDASPPTVGNHPLVVFQGGDWASTRDMTVLRNLFLDYLRGDSQPSDLNLGGVERAVVLTAVDGVVHLRQFMLGMKNAGVRTPHVQLLECGPRISFACKRSALADEEARKVATRAPKKPKLPKNVERPGMGADVGRVHVGRQNLDELDRTTRKQKALRAPKRSVDGADGSGKRVHRDEDEAGPADA